MEKIKSKNDIQGLCWLLIVLCILVTACSHHPLQSLDKKHHTATGFTNPWIPGDKGPSEAEIMNWALKISTLRNKDYNTESVPPDLEAIYHPDSTKMQVTWIGHSTFLIQWQGKNILTDPVFATRASPLPFMGPKRQGKPGIAFKDLPPIDAVIISHNHYDHLGYSSVKALGNRPMYFVPLGLARWFKGYQITHVKEMDWWDSEEFGPFRFTLVPAQHFSNRSIADMDKTLWGGWVVESLAQESPIRRFYFAGDTGYGPFFKDIGQQFGEMDLAFIPIGAYLPRPSMERYHITPEEAVRVHEDVRSKHSLAMHWGTFRLTEEPFDEPPIRLKKALKAENIPESAFTTMVIGKTESFLASPFIPTAE